MRTLGTVSIMILFLLQRCRSRRSPSLRLLPSSSANRRRRRLPLTPTSSSSSFSFARCDDDDDDDDDCRDDWSDDIIAPTSTSTKTTTKKSTRTSCWGGNVLASFLTPSRPSSSSPVAAFAFGVCVDPGRCHRGGFRSTTAGRRFLVSSSPMAAGPPSSSPSSFVDDESKYRPSPPESGRMAKKDDDDVLSVRNLYKFRPLRPGSSRSMPPPSFEFDDCGGGNEGEDSAADLVADDASNRNDVAAEPACVGTTSVAGRSRMTTMPNETPPSSGVAAATTTGIDATEEEEDPSGGAPPSDGLPPPSSPPPHAPPIDRRATTAPTAKVASPRGADAPPYANGRRFAPRATPSFMEPERVRAMTTSSNAAADDPENDGGVGTADPARRVLPPAEASKSGNSGTTNLAALTRQLEHLASRIYRLNDGVEFNVNSPRQVARVLFGDDAVDNSTDKDALEAMASAGNEMAACIYKYRKLSREAKREARRIEQSERGDRKNDYYGNLARHDDRKRRGGIVGENEAASEYCDDGDGMNGDNNAGSVKSATSSYERAISEGNAAWEPHRREPLLLIDASAYIFRAYHAIPPLHRTDGTPTGALHGVCRMLQNLLLPRLLRGERPRVVLAFDFGGKNFRHDAYPEYKANRGPCPEDLVPQFELVREASEAFGVVRVEAEGYEADDVIATLTRRALEEGVDVDILSGDKVSMFRVNTKPMGFAMTPPLIPSSDFIHFAARFHVSPFQPEGPDAVDNPRVSQFLLHVIPDIFLVSLC